MSSDDEIKDTLARAEPYADWLREHLFDIEDLPAGPEWPLPDSVALRQRQRVFGYTDEDLKLLIGPMARVGEEPLGSMGSDAALAVLSDRPRLLYDYFAQLFAQVTNPPLDAIREKLVTSMASTVGPEANLLEPTPASCRQIKITYPIIDNEQLAKLRHIQLAGFHTTSLPMVFEPELGGVGLERAMAALCRRAEEAVASGTTILILSDRGLSQAEAPIPSLLATSGVHHHLVRTGLRTRCALIIESGDAREVHHVALLIGYGAGAVNPYLAFETLEDMIRQGALEGVTHAQAVGNYIRSLNAGILKVMSKMGISTLQSYCGAQIFEAIGLERAFVDRYFTSTSSRIGGVGLDVVAEEVRRRHAQAYAVRGGVSTELDPGGEYQWRRDGEFHLFNPDTVFKLQHATRSGQYSIYRDYARRVNDQSRRLGTLRGLFSLKPAATPLSIDEVEPVASIVRRFATGAMSYGSISQEAHETLAIAMNRLGGRSNSGEGGEDPARNVPDANGDSRKSAVRQIASARFGVTSEYLVNADDLQIKMAQGAKPGEGGQLPGFKVYPWIAKVRHSTPGVTLISPPPHHDIYSIEDLAQLIYDLKNANDRARIHVKLVAEVGVGTIAAGVAKAHADVVLISGHDGGTGASPLTSIKHSGAPWELGLAEAQQVLVLNRLRDRIVVQVDGQMKTGRDVVIAALLGAEEFGFATAPLVVSGCVMMRVCHLNTCPVGIATQDPALRALFTGTPGVRRELLPVRGRGSARADGRAGIPDDRRDDRARRSARRAVRRRALEGEGTRPQLDALRGGRARLRVAASDDDAGSRARPGASIRQLIAEARAGARAGAARRDPPRPPQRASHRRDAARVGGHAPVRCGGPARRHDSPPVHGHGGAEPRGVHAARRDHHARGRGQRLRRQGALRRPDHRPAAARRDVRVRGERHHRQRRALRRDGR